MAVHGAGDGDGLCRLAGPVAGGFGDRGQVIDEERHDAADAAPGRGPQTVHAQRRIGRNGDGEGATTCIRPVVFDPAGQLALAGARRPQLGGTVERAAYNLEHLGTFPIEDAWVIATTPSELTPLGVEQTRKVTDVLVEASGRPFPDDYICVAQVASFQLWKPAKVESPNAVCPPSGISSSYNASVGWDP